VKVENYHFGPLTKTQYPQNESQIPKCHLILYFVQDQFSIKHQLTVRSLTVHTYYQLGS